MYSIFIAIYFHQQCPDVVKIGREMIHAALITGLALSDLSGLRHE
jgi:hypothetical protein